MLRNFPDEQNLEGLIRLSEVHCPNGADKFIDASVYSVHPAVGLYHALRQSHHCVVKAFDVPLHPVDATNQGLDATNQNLDCPGQNIDLPRERLNGNGGSLGDLLDTGETFIIDRLIYE